MGPLAKISWAARGVSAIVSLAMLPAVTLWSPAPARAAIGLELVTTAQNPLYLWNAGPGDDRLFILERQGSIVIYKPGQGLLPTPFLDIESKVQVEGERGLFAIAFHPDFPTTPYFYVSYFGMNPVSGNVVARYRISDTDPDLADPASEVIVFSVQQPSGQHNGGQIAFGPDGYLYLSVGDGGGSNDQACNAQRGDTLLGKMVRIDVDQNFNQAPYHGVPATNPYTAANDPLDETLDEIWAHGLRNPWRFSFDTLTGNLFIGDVGQDGREEIDFEAAGSPGGLNFGWKLMEGLQCKNPNAGNCPPSTPPCFDPAYTDPIVDILHSDACAVTGGFVYRGSAVPDLYGKYIFGDFCSARIWSVEEISPGLWGNRQLLIEDNIRLRSFGQDSDGEIYALEDDEVFRIVDASTLDQEQTTGQQTCINNMNRRGSDIVKVRGRLDADCVKSAGKARLHTLGLPPSEQTLAGCLAFDVKNRVARKIIEVQKQEDRKCRVAEKPELFPDFGFTSTASVASGAVKAANRYTRSLLGDDVDAALILEENDDQGARCQRVASKVSQTILATTWKLAIEGKRKSLNGALGDPAITAAQMGSDVLTYVDEQITAGRLTRRSDQLVRALDRNCPAGGPAPFATRLPGECSTAPDSTSFTACMVDRARCHFCRSFETFDGLTLDCDLFDDASTNGSCPSEAEILCGQPGTGVNFDAFDVDCATLDGYRLFTDPADPTSGPNDARARLFDLTTPLYADYSQKYRFVFLPPGEAATYDASDPFSFPIGTILAKTFSFADDLRNPALGETLVETRLLIHRALGWRGLTYVWDEMTGVATLAQDGATADVSWIHFDGSPRQTTYEIPALVECAECHDSPLEPGDAPIGPKARLLNHDLDYGGGLENQLDHWSAHGLLLGAPASASAPRLPVWDDPGDGTLQERAFAYLETNCAHCHNPDGKAAFTGLDLRHDEPVGPDRGVCQVSGFGGIPGLIHNIEPGDSSQSILFFRTDSVSEGLKMPQILKTVVHEEGVDLIEQWIDSLTGSCS